MQSEPSPVIWIIHSDPAQREACVMAAQQSGLIVIPLGSARQGLASLNEGGGFIPDLILYDGAVKDMSPGEFHSALVKVLGDEAPPVVFVADPAKSAEPLTPASLRKGKDIVLLRPLHARDLIRTMRSAVTSPEDASLLVHASGLELDVERRVLSYKNRYVRLTRMESRLVEHLMRRSPRLVRYEELLDQVWRFAPGTGGADIVRSHVGNLRRKLGSLGAPRDLLWNIPRRGYGLRDSPIRGSS